MGGASSIPMIWRKNCTCVHTVKIHFSACEKIMRIGQNGPLEKITRCMFNFCRKRASVKNFYGENFAIYRNTAIVII